LSAEAPSGGTTPGKGAARRAERLAVVPTARGWQAIVIGVFVLFIARLIGTTQFHQLAYALLALPLASLATGMLGTRGLRFSRALSRGERITAGSPACVELRLANASRFGTSGVGVSDHLPGRRDFEVAPLGARGETTVEVPLTFARRGLYELGPAEARVVDPFGLLRFVRHFEERTEVVVYPKVYDLPNFPLRGADVEADARGSVGQRGDEFAGLREYRRGDDRRHIHWKSVARTGELFVKEFAIHAPRRYTVALDLRREGLRNVEGEVEDAVSAAASVLAHLSRERLPSRLLCTDRAGAETSFGSDAASYWEAMRLLATARADGERDIGEVVLAQRGNLGEGVVLVSRTRDEELPACVRRLRGAGLSVVVVALATHTYRTPPVGSAAGSAGGVAHKREAEFARTVGRLETAGAAVRVVREGAGVAGLSGNTQKGAV
jgi:uncharacterized protein (DUF58 family)